jgi:hypothetical protein
MDGVLATGHHLVFWHDPKWLAEANAIGICPNMFQYLYFDPPKDVSRYRFPKLLYFV